MKRNGQTMLEILVALTLVVLFLSGIVIVQLYALRNVQFSRNKTTATKLALQQLERVRAVRDSAGIDELNICRSTCFINGELTPVPVTPTGTFGQSVIMQPAAVFDCPVPTDAVLIPPPQYYKITAQAQWGNAAVITPEPKVIVNSCLTDLQR